MRVGTDHVQRRDVCIVTITFQGKSYEVRPAVPVTFRSRWGLRPYRWHLLDSPRPARLLLKCCESSLAIIHSDSIHLSSRNGRWRRRFAMATSSATRRFWGETFWHRSVSIPPRGARVFCWRFRRCCGFVVVRVLRGCWVSPRSEWACGCRIDSSSAPPLPPPNFFARLPSRFGGQDNFLVHIMPS